VTIENTHDGEQTLLSECSVCIADRPTPNKEQHSSIHGFEVFIHLLFRIYDARLVLHMDAHKQRRLSPDLLRDISNEISALHGKLLSVGKSACVLENYTATERAFRAIQCTIRSASQRPRNLFRLQTQLNVYLLLAHSVLDGVDYHNENFPRHINITNIASQLETIEAICDEVHSSRSGRLIILDTERIE